MSETDGFFGDPEDLAKEVDRDNQGRPLIRQEDGSRLAYTRASSLGDYVSKTDFLRTWELRYLARQMGKHEDLAALAGIETYSTGFDEDSVTKSQSGKRLDSIIARAFDRGRIHERADYGTVVHAITEPGNEGYVPIRAAMDHAAFWEFIELNDIEILGTEVFVVNDYLKAAGTFDHLIRYDNRVYIADKKNGRNINGLGFSVQFFTYAGAVIYDPETETRTPLTSLTGGQPIDQELAILFDVKNGHCLARDVDIKRGAVAARLAARVRDAQEWTEMAGVSKRFKQVHGRSRAFKERAIIRRVNAATHPAELVGMWTYYGPSGTGDWPADREHPISKAAQAKKEQEGWT